MCAKFRGSRAIVGLVGLVPSWLNGYFLGPNGYFVCPKCFLVSISWVHFFSCSWFRDSKILSCWLHEQEWQKQKYKNTLVFICSNCIFRHLFSSVLGSFQRYLLQLLGLLFYNYSSFLIDNSPYSPPGKNPSSFCNFMSIWHSKTPRFRGSGHSQNSQFLGVTLNAWRAVWT